MQSVTFEEFPQPSGRKHILFRFVTDAGDVIVQQGFYDSSMDATALGADLAAQIDASLARAEVEQNLEEIVGA